MKAWLFKQKIKLRSKREALSRHRFFAPISDLVARYGETEIANSAAVSTYFILLALFPLLIIVTSIITSVSGDSLMSYVDSTQIRNVLPQDVVDLILSFLDSTAGGQSVSVLSFSIIGLIWSASRGFGAIIGGLNRTYMAPKQSSFFVRRLLGAVIVLLLGLSMFLVMIVLAFSEFIFRRIADLFKLLDIPITIDPDGLLLRLLPYVLSFAYLILIFTAIYYFSSGRSGKLKHAAVAGLFTTVVWLLFSFGFSFYINNFSNYSVIYGSLTAVILLMLWVYFSVQFLLIGAFLHRELLRYRGYSIYQPRAAD